MTLLRKQIPQWVKNYPDEADREVLIRLARASRFEKPREMNFCLYGLTAGQDLEEIWDQLTKAGWNPSVQPQADAPGKFVLTATKKDYVITEASYNHDTVFFRRIAERYHVGYDGWFASNS